MKNDKLVHRTVERTSDLYTHGRSTRRTEITIETREIKTIRMRSVGGSTFCSVCGEIATAYGPEQVAVFLQIGLDDVLRSIESDQIHLMASRSAPNDICGNSLRYLVHDRRSATDAIGLKKIQE